MLWVGLEIEGQWEGTVHVSDIVHSSSRQALRAATDVAAVGRLLSRRVGSTQCYRRCHSDGHRARQARITTDRSVLTKTKRTGQNINTDKISRLVASATLSGPGFYKALYKKTGDKKAKGPAGDRGSSARMRDGETVGEGADRIGVENVGHRLLSKMGWAEGGRIGRSEGGLDVP